MPGAPTRLAISDVDETSVGLRWDEPVSDGGSDIAGYVVEVREAERRAWQRAGSSACDERHYAASLLSAGQKYVFRVAAQNDVGTGEFAELSQAVVPKSKFGEHKM